MTTGFSIIEILISLSLCLILFTITISSTITSSGHLNKIQSKTENLETVFYLVDSIKSDLEKCGIFLQEAQHLFSLKVIDVSEIHFSIKFGSQCTNLKQAAQPTETYLTVFPQFLLTKSSEIIIYNEKQQQIEFNTAIKASAGSVELKTPLKNWFAEDSVIVAVETIEYKYFKNSQTLKKKINNGYFQPMADHITDFYIQFFPESNSVLYRIELNFIEQIQGYIFMTNMDIK
jgi:type II secretory pathway component PulJ